MCRCVQVIPGRVWSAGVAGVGHAVRDTPPGSGHEPPAARRLCRHRLQRRCRRLDRRGGLPQQERRSRWCGSASMHLCLLVTGAPACLPWAEKGGRGGGRRAPRWWSRGACRRHIGRIGSRSELSRSLHIWHANPTSHLTSWVVNTLKPLTVSPQRPSISWARLRVLAAAALNRSPSARDVMCCLWGYNLPPRRAAVSPHSLRRQQRPPSA